MTETALDFLLDYLTQLKRSNHRFVLELYRKKLIKKDQIEWLYGELQFFRMFLKESGGNCNERMQVESVVTKIRNLTYKIEDFIDLSILAIVVEKSRSFHDPLRGSFMQEIDKDFPFFIPQNEIEDFHARAFSENKRDINGKKEDGGFLENMGNVILQEENGDFPEIIEDIIVQEEDGGVLDYSGDLSMQEGDGGFLENSVELIMPEEDGGFLESTGDPIVRPEDEAIPETMIRKEDGGTHENMREDGEFLQKIEYAIMKNFSPDKLGVDSRKKKNVMETIKSLMAKKTHLCYKIMTILGLKSDHVAGIIRHGFGSIIKEIKSIRKELMKIEKRKKYGVGVLQTEESSDAAPSNAGSHMVEEDTIMGIDDEKMAMIDLLTGEHGRQLKVISIVGMPGLGKTALARLVYSDPLIVYHFYVRAWTFVSQVYRKRDLLVDILCSGFKLRDEISQISDGTLGDELYKRLKGKRYLIIMDDIWDPGAWNVVKTYFPNDHNGSRIIFTSRLGIEALHAKPHYLRFLNEDESWDLLQMKIFKKESCPQELIEVGKQIAKKCQGLPLAILVISGLLAKGNKTRKWWKHVADSVSSYIVSDPKKYMDTLALSYDYLPSHLRECFLYFGAFPEDYEIHVWKLIWLWIAEGLIRWNEQRCLEEVAEDYLMDLIDRSLLIVSQIGSDGKIKTCRIHDLLRDLCLRKAQEVNFLRQISGYLQTTFYYIGTFQNKERRLSIHSNLVHHNSFPNKLHVRSFLSFGPSFYDLPGKDVSFIFKAFKLLRVLNLSSVKMVSFPKEIMLLVHLRYLALRVGHHMGFHLSISDLWNLETLIVEGPKGLLVFSDDVWKMVKLRHLYSNLLIHIPLPKNGNPSILDNLQTLCKLDLSGFNKGNVDLFYFDSEKLLRGISNIKKLKYCGRICKLDFLIHLEKLNISSFNRQCQFYLDVDDFPPNLKCLTLSNSELCWEEMSILGRLPYLEVLKLSFKAFEGSRWDTNDGEFRKLRFLKFQRLGIVQWNASSQHFSRLQTLVLDDCPLLKEIPCSFGDIPTLEMIQLRYCSQSAESSAKQIQEQQQSMGNDGLKIHVHSYHETLW